jgi:DNA-damage-inducible protein D
MQSQTPNFDAIKRTNMYGEDYWSARELMPLLGYGKKWQNFEGVIKKAMIACAESGNIIEHHFTDASKPIAGGKGAIQQVKDYFLSRLACYLIGQNGDPRKPEIAAAQLYFAVSTRAHEIHQLREEQERRLQMRLKVSESYTQLAQAAGQSGAESEQFGLFVDAGYLGLHHHTVEELKAKKGIPAKEDYLDNITREELSAIDFKNVLTEGKLTQEHVSGLENAMHTHYFVGSEVRKAIEAVHRPMPEELPSAPSIRKMVEERRRARRKQLHKKEQQEQGGQEKLL